MESRRSILLLNGGFILSVAAYISYFRVFVRWPVTRDFPWASYMLFGIAVVMLVAGFRAARRKVVPGIITFLGIGVLMVFIVIVSVGSRKLPSVSGAPRVGQKAREFALVDTNHQTVTLTQLLSTSPRGVLLIFYRGYWSPFCNAELRSIEENLAAFEREGVRPVAISVDTPKESSHLCRRAGYTYTFLSDPKAEAIRRYGVLHTGKEVPNDIARPAEFLIDKSGVVRWENVTEDLRVRARPQEMLAAARQLN